ncbi:hypothetical protein CMUS01_15539 [Colletotrichum musicola]|uniref:Uncharacterized protein n=1 Tax=Colletotrichum musicola TaxID=2175873 RepID=A0A8H6IVJ4_9PEZI|nr:hypothetical protein CMUS01_15539 [Colletotrichum musicola]
MEASGSTVRRRIVRRPRFRREDLRIEIRDDPGDISSDDDSPSPTNKSFSHTGTKTHSPKKTDSPKLPQQPPPVALNPANPTKTDSPTSSSFPTSLPTAPPRGPGRQNPPATSFSSSITTTESTRRTSSLPTAFPESQFTNSNGARPTGSADGSDIGLGSARSSEVGWTPTAIAFGTIAIAALFLCIGWGLWWFLRYRKRRKARDMYDRSMSPESQLWNPASSFSAPTAPVRRSPSSVMAELMGAAFAAQGGNSGRDRNSLTPQGYLDEKTYDPARQLPILEPAPVHQPNVRNSVASWIRRHHPLKLNPLSGRSSVYSTRTLGASAPDVNAPPVPAVPDAYRPGSQQSSLQVPQATGNQNRYTSSSHYGTENPPDYSASSILSLYQTEQPSGQHPQAPWLQEPPPLRHSERGVSMAPTEATARTESTWRSWGGGVTQPREHAPPETPRRGWIEKCIKFGGLK